MGHRSLRLKRHKETGERDRINVAAHDLLHRPPRLFGREIAPFDESVGQCGPRIDFLIRHGAHIKA